MCVEEEEEDLKQVVQRRFLITLFNSQHDTELLLFKVVKSGWYIKGLFSDSGWTRYW
jgi:hypothetical protein